MVGPSVRIKMRRQIVGESGEPIGSHSQRNSIDPNLASLVDPVKLQHNTFASGCCRERELFSVPTDSGGQISSVPSGRCIFAERTFDAPVVGKVQRSPAAVLEIRRLRTLRVAFEESPLAVEICLSLRGRSGNGFGK